MAWSLYSNESFLKPLCFSNGKSQEEVVSEILLKIKEGKKVIFIHGMCGTGKSAIALNLARVLGKTSVVVPGKNLQNQYKNDYEGEKYLLKENGERLKISVITGRNNHKCKFLEDNDAAIPRVKKEINSRLNDIFSARREAIKKTISEDESAANRELPCKIEIKEKNWGRLKEYIKQNPRIQLSDFSSIKDVKRMSVAPVCPYWSPVLPEKYELKSLDNVKKTRSYEGLLGTRFTQYIRKPGCPFYEQFNSYFDSDVIVFNSLKYQLETALLRKPKTEVEIIDECDLFLDSFSNERTINVERLQNSLFQALSSLEGDQEKIEEVLELLDHFKRNEKLNDQRNNEEIIELRQTGIYDILKIFLSETWLKEIDEESYLFDIVETAKLFSNFLDESYVTFTKNENSTFVHVVSINLDKRFKDLVEKNKVVVLMSGTLHSDDVLSEIFGLSDFEKVDAEVKPLGKVEIKKTGFEFDCKYSNFSNNKFSREDYLIALDKVIGEAKRPTVVHVNAYADLPRDTEISEYGLTSLISRDKLKERQFKDKNGKIVAEFKAGLRDILFSTRDSRGIDFPGEECNSIVFTKYPNPNVQDPFWKILMKTRPDKYWSFYRDKARREFLQKIYRGLRSVNDKVELWSPDARVLEKAEEEFC